MFYKAIDLSLAELKFASNDTGVFEGYASVFNSIDLGGDTVLPGAYKATLENRKTPVQMLNMHRRGQVIGKWLDIAEDSKGLAVRGQFTPGNRLAEDIKANVKFGAQGGLSIGFSLPDGGYDSIGEGRRILKTIHLHEISVVDMPMDEWAGIENIKAAIEQISTLSDAEAMLRDAAGLSRKEATAFVSRLKAILQSDSGEGEAAKQTEEIVRAGMALGDLKFVLSQFTIPKSLTKGK